MPANANLRVQRKKLCGQERHGAEDAKDANGCDGSRIQQANGKKNKLDSFPSSPPGKLGGQRRIKQHKTSEVILLQRNELIKFNKMGCKTQTSGRTGSSAWFYVRCTVSVGPGSQNQALLGWALSVRSNEARRW